MKQTKLIFWVNYRVMVIIFFILWLSFTAIAADEGGEPFAYMKLGINAEAIALGQAVSSLWHINNAFYWNPALSALQKNNILSLNFNQPYSKIDDITFHSAAYSAAGKKTVVGVLISSLNVKNIPAASETLQNSGTYLTGNTFRHNEFLIIANVSRIMLKKEIGLGLNAKYIKQKIYNYSGKLFGMDAGLIYFRKNLSFGFVLGNIMSSSLKLRNKQEKLKFYFKTGISIRLIKDMIISSDLKFQKNKSIKNFIGLKYSWNNKLQFMSGYNNETDLFTAGFGVLLKYYQLNYAVNYHEELGLGHRLSIDFKFAHIVR